MRKHFSIALLALIVACSQKDPCDDYVDAACVCLDDSDCDELKTTYENADADLQDVCSEELSSAEKEAEECEPGGSSDGDDTGSEG